MSMKSALILMKLGHVSGCLLLINEIRILFCRSFDGLHLVAPSQDTDIKTDHGDRLVQIRLYFVRMSIDLLMICTIIRNCFCLTMSSTDHITQNLLIGTSRHSICWIG